MVAFAEEHLRGHTASYGALSPERMIAWRGLVQSAVGPVAETILARYPRPETPHRGVFGLARFTEERVCGHAPMPRAIAFSRAAGQCGPTGEHVEAILKSAIEHCQGCNRVQLPERLRRA